MKPRDFSRFLIATDLDGTFVFRGRPVPVNERAVAEFCEGGGIFTIDTGRLHPTVRSAIGEPCRLINAPAVLSGGAYLYDFEVGQIVPQTAEYMSPADTRELLALIHGRFPDVLFRVSTSDYQRMERLTGPMIADAAMHDPGSVAISTPAEAWPDDNWFKMVIRGTDEDLSRLRDEVTARFSGRLCCCFSNRRLLEILKSGVDKGGGLEKLRARFPNRVAVGCGDYENDLPLLAAADIAACPADAYGPVRAMADVILPPCEEGIMPALLDYLSARKENEK